MFVLLFEREERGSLKGPTESLFDTFSPHLPLLSPPPLPSLLFSAPACLHRSLLCASLSCVPCICGLRLRWFQHVPWNECALPADHLFGGRMGIWNIFRVRRRRRALWCMRLLASADVPKCKGNRGEDFLFFLWGRESKPRDMREWSIVLSFFLNEEENPMARALFCTRVMLLSSATKGCPADRGYCQLCFPFIDIC